MPSDQRAMMFQQVFNISETGEITDGGINVIPVRVSGDSKKNNFQPFILGTKAGTKLLKAIARYSNLNRNTLWMTASYPEQIGLIKTAVGNAAPSASTNAVEAVQTTAGEAQAEEDDMPAPDYALTGGVAGVQPAQVEATKQPTLGSTELTQEQKTQIQEQIYYDQMVK